MTAAYGRVRDAEILAIWHGSENGLPSSLSCPMCARPMVSVDVSGDSDAPEHVTVEVCREDEVFWLDAGELDELPRNEPKAAPSEQEQRNLELIRRDFDQGLDRAHHEEESRSDRMADAFARRHPGFTRMLDEAVYHQDFDDLQDSADPADSPR
jgi:Zn-finger nucleic acid-binding protein